MPEFIAGDMVVHSHYPDVRGTVIRRYRPQDNGAPIYLVRWSPRVQKKAQSRHLGSALRNAEAQ